MEHLPCELIICILLTLEDFTDLYNAIRTSRTIYAAFLAARIQILSLTLRWTMPRQLLRHALIIPSSVDVSFLQEDSVPTENWLQNYFYTPSEQFSYPLPTDPIFNKVVRLHVIIQRFTKHFCELGLKIYHWMRESVSIVLFTASNSTRISSPWTCIGDVFLKRGAHS